MLLYLVRHAQTELNEAGIVQGSIDPPLSAEGVVQAQTVAEWLRLVPFTEIWSSPLTRARETAKAIIAAQPKFKSHLRVDDRLTTRGAGDAQGKKWNEVAGRMGEMGIESDESLSDRLHAFLSTLLHTHTPASSATATPVSGSGTASGLASMTPMTPGAGADADTPGLDALSLNNAPILERPGTATSGLGGGANPNSIVGLPRPGISRKPTNQAGSGLGSGVVLLVTHQECITSLLRILTSPTTAYSGLAPVPGVGEGELKKSPIELHVPSTVDLGDGQVGNTSVAILRVWWEDDDAALGGLEARGRLEAWGVEEHLQDNKGAEA